MKNNIVLLTMFILFLLIGVIEADAAKFSNILNVFSKNSTATKTIATSSEDTKTSIKSESTKTEDKPSFEKEYSSLVTSKDKTGVNVKTKSMTKTGDPKTSEKAKELSKMQSKWKVTDDGKLKIDGKANSICISLPDQTITPQDTQVAQKQYEFRSGKVTCTGGFFADQTLDDPAIEILECTPVELRAKCKEGFVLSYGGSCSYGEGTSLQFRGIEKLYAIPSFFGSDWDDLPSSIEVMIRCNTELNIAPPRGMELPTEANPVAVDKALYITCVREKS